MPNMDMSLNMLREYTGSMPRPTDFREFWDKKVKEAWEQPLRYSITDSEIPHSETTRYYDIWLDGMNGAKLYAKYILPVRQEKVPVILQFHGYPGASRGWFEQSSFAGLGMAVLAMDCPGQGGASIYAGAPEGTTAGDHIVMGLGGEPEGLYYVEVFQDTCLMVRLALELAELDSERIFVNGASQGAGLGLVCTALNPQYIRKCAALYPFLTDYRRAWDMDRDVIVFDGMKYCTRWFDPTGAKLEEMFYKLGYIDVLNFVEYITCPVMFGTGLIDAVIPPSAQFAAYGKMKCPKQYLIYPDYGHEEIADFDDRIPDFFLKEGE